MNKKQRRLKSRLQSQTSLAAHQSALLETKNRQLHQLQERNAELGYRVDNQRDAYHWNLARYRWVDQVLESALRSFPGHPLQRLMDTHRAIPDHNPYEFWDLVVLPKVLPYGPNLNEQIRDVVADLLRHYALQYDFRYNEIRSQSYIRLSFKGKEVGYFCPKELRGMPPQEKFNLVMRELTPAVISLLERD